MKSLLTIAAVAGLLSSCSSLQTPDGVSHSDGRSVEPSEENAKPAAPDDETKKKDSKPGNGDTGSSGQNKKEGDGGGEENQPDPADLVDLHLSPSPGTLRKGDSVTISFKGLYSDDTVSTYEGELTVTSADEAVATAHLSDGRLSVSAVSPGHTELKVEAAGEVSANYPLRVLRPLATQVSLRAAGALEVGSCHPLRLQLKGPEDGEAVAESRTVFALSGAETPFYSDAACSESTDEVAIEADGSSAEVFTERTGSGTFFGTVESESLNKSFELDFVPSSPEDMSLSGPATVTAGDCARYTLDLSDEYGNQAPTSGDSVTIEAGDRTEIFETSGCDAPLPEESGGEWKLSFEAGSEFLEFFVRREKAGSDLLEVSSASLGSKSLWVDIHAGPPSDAPWPSVYGGSPGSPDSGQPSNLWYYEFFQDLCTDGIRVSLNDKYGNPTSYDQDTLVAVSGEEILYEDPNCSTPLAGEVMFSADQHDRTFYVNPSDTETTFVSFGEAGRTVGITGLGQPDGLWLSGPEEPEIGKCERYYFGFHDAEGETTESLEESVVTLDSEGELTFYSDRDCDTSVTEVSFERHDHGHEFYIRPGEAEDVISVKTANLADDSLEITPTAGPPSGFLVFGPDSIDVSLVEDRCHGPFRGTLVDSEDNPVTVSKDLSVDVGITGSRWYTSSSCADSSRVFTTPLAEGASQTDLFYYKSHSGLTEGHRISLPPFETEFNGSTVRGSKSVLVE